MVAEAGRMVDLYGIQTFKVKVGRRPVSLDTAVVRALRERFGGAVELYVDGNRGWSPAEARQAMGEMADLDLLFAEFHPYLARTLKMPLIDGFEDFLRKVTQHAACRVGISSVDDESFLGDGVPLPSAEGRGSSKG